MVGIYVTHYVRRGLPGYNDMVVECASILQRVMKLDGDAATLTIVYWTDDEELDADLRARLPAGVDAVRRDSGSQTYLMNQATEIAKQRGDDLFVCLHNDVKPARGWLRNLVTDVRAAEMKYGRGNVIASPRYLPYHWGNPCPAAFKDPAFWDRIRPEVEAKVLSNAAMRAWCDKHGFSFDGDLVHSPRTSFTTDDGHALMMYCAAPNFFDVIGGCDESFVGTNYGDCDWGIRALRAGKKNLISQGALLGHISGLTFFHPTVRSELDDNDNRFIAKWDLSTFRELIDGSIWPRLHREQAR